jgi:hypothetical protein
MSNDMVGELLTQCRTGNSELVKENAYQLLLKLAGDGVRGARGAIAAIERAKALREEKQSTARKNGKG